MKAQHAADQGQQQPPMSFWTQPPLPQHGYQPPTVSSPLFSPPIDTPNPHHASNVISPASRNSPFPAPGAFAHTPGQNNSNHLLSLLRSNGSQQASEGGLMSGLQNIHAPEASQRSSSAQYNKMLSASDYVSSLQRRPSAQSHTPAAPFESTANQANTQDFLLNLLTKPSKTASPATSQAGAAPFDANTKSTDAASVNRLAQSLAETSIQPAQSPKPEASSIPLANSSNAVPLEAPQPTKGGMFSYVNPFDQLHESSPLNRTPQPQAQEKKIEILKHDRAISDNLNGELGAPATKTRKLSSSNKQPVYQAAEALEGPQSVSKKLEEVSGQVQNEAEEALATATKEEASVAAKAKHNTPVVEKRAGEDTVDTDWSTAEDEDAKQEEDAKVEVFNFPMKPFVTLQLTSGRVARPFKPSTWESATPIARLKKEFSHDDRALATASQSHIIYAVVPSEKKPDTGLKIIRQEDGKNKHVWAKTGERLCNVQVSALTQGDVESVLATGVNGTIFYTTLARSRGDLFDDDNVEAQGFIMSPPPNSDEPSSSSTFGTSSAIKTRAKLSNRHSDQYFAVARGRQIHLIAPEIVKDRAYTDKNTYVVHTEKYLAEHSLSINTAKAGKDFCFSEDDTTLISLDKVGKVKFWDIRSLTSAIESVSQGSFDKAPRNELKDPIFSFAAGASPLHPDDKMSPSSVMLLDKDRPCAKGVALRYLLVGFQQNHILQLWDLGLGKCVQELRFPESPGSTNAMCTVNYHPKSGIICASHPGRNSIYFIHLSAPRYNLPQMSQAAYINLLARQDQSLPRPESTAIMSGMREYSLGKVGELRSVDMLKTPFPAGTPSDDAAMETLFELYIEHSKGVVGMLIKRDDLGWDAKGKMVKPKDAIEAGLVKVGELNPPRPAESSAAPQPEILTRQPTKSKKDRENVKPEPKVQVKEAAPSNPAPAANGAPPVELEQSKQIPEAPAATNPPLMTPDSYAMAAQKAKSPSREREAGMPAIAQESTAKSQASSMAPDVITPAKSTTDTNIQGLLSQQFASLYLKIDQDKRVADASNAAKQDAILRLVSSTLTENVESTLHKIVSTSIENNVVPALTSNTSKVIERKLSETLNKQVSESIAKELKTAIPSAVTAALRDGQVTRALSTHVVDEVTKQVKMDMGGLVQRSMQTVQTNMASQMTQSSQSSQKVILDVESKLSANLREVSQQQTQQREMLAQLTSSVQDLAAMVQSMKEENGRLLSQASQKKPESQASATPAQPEPAPETQVTQSEEPTEVARLTQMLKNAEYQQATIEWLQSPNQAELFDNLFMFLNPLYLQQVSSLVALSVSAAITSSFETNVDKRLEWLGTIVSNMDTAVSSQSYFPFI